MSYYPYYSSYGQPNFNATPQPQPFYQSQPNIAQNGTQGVNQQMQYQMPPMPMQSTTTNIEYVNGIEGAKALILPPNATRILMDSDRKYFYIKRTDAQGRPTLEAHPYTDEVEAPQQPAPAQPQQQFVPIEQFNRLSEEFSQLKETVANLQYIKPVVSRNGGKKDAE